jgi:hypothetical protein
MNNEINALANLNAIVSTRKVKVWNSLRLAVRKAKSQEAEYGFMNALDLWGKASDLYAKHTRLTANPVSFEDVKMMV